MVVAVAVVAAVVVVVVVVVPSRYASRIEEFLRLAVVAAAKQWTQAITTYVYIYIYACLIVPNG